MAGAARQTAPKGIRKDPPTVSLGGFDDWLELVNKDPKLAYCWVNKLSTGAAGVSYYRSQGYKVVKYVAGGVMPKGNEDLVEGEPIENQDTVLMCIPVELKKAIEKRGQLMADAIEAKMRRRGRVVDALQGMNVRGDSGDDMITEWNETSGEQSITTGFGG